MSSIQPFRIDVPEERLIRLRQKLQLADLPDELEDSAWERGSPLADIKRLLAFWIDGYDWRKAEKKLNQMPQFMTKITIHGFDPLNVHFIHQKSHVANAIPLIFVHGWPGSFDEVSKILPNLVSGGKDFPAFHVVAPSLPNFGFSQGTKQKGFTSKRHAQVCHQLMVDLGYDQYVTQGGDIGRAVTRGLGLLYPGSCRASHLNFSVPNPPTIQEHPDLFFQSQQTPLDAAERAGLDRSKWFRNEGYGYNLEQSTKPQTIGYSMTDSPVGLLAWIYEKLHDWTDSYQWTDTEVLTWVSIYYFSAAGPAASQRIYYESTHDSEEFSKKISSYIPDVKLGVARFPKELLIMPRHWVKTMGPVVYESEYEQGGHFAAWERPDAIVKDLREMFGKSGGAYACVQGRSGFE